MSADSAAEPDEGPTEDELQRVCEELGKSWYSVFENLTNLELGREDQELDPHRFLIVYAYAAHAQKLTVSACHHLVDLDYAVAGPLLRVAYESALTAVWAAESEEAARAIHYALVKASGKLRGSALKTSWFDDVLDLIPEPDPAPEDTAPRARGEATTFFKLCESLEPDSEWLYMQFRLLSAYAHPSGEVIKMFVDGEAPTISRNPVAASSGVRRALWSAAAHNMLFAGQALDRLDPSARRRDALERAGASIGWDEPLRLSESAKRAVQDARAAREAAASERPSG
ncbi:hypothetical protein [Hoeflea sp.]|uniref:hypothetical protein n=1 Tax=Hoeflea sp. TaxID=1940281 RepID=UPI001984C76C|nr:hypothetical protein [Hoeflea sp.]MBC7285994.1 hypothetical protein [Hoeflea sp.]